VRDALGGTVTLVIIVVFIVIVLSYLAFNVNYTKAFRMKDKIIAYYDDYNGDCNDACLNKIAAYADSIGYVSDNRCPDGYEQNGYFCYQDIVVEGGRAEGYYGGADKVHYYKIVTRINLNIPFITSTFGFNIFNIYGSTKTYKIIE